MLGANNKIKAFNLEKSSSNNARIPNLFNNFTHFVSRILNIRQTSAERGLSSEILVAKETKGDMPLTVPKTPIFFRRK